MDDTDGVRYEGVVIYDGECAFCSAVSSALRRLPDVGTVDWDDPAAQSFLEAQFGDPVFALVFVDREAGDVYVGRETARELCGRAGMPAIVRDVVGDGYESFADAIRSVTGVERVSDPYHGTYPLAPDAAERYPALSAAADSLDVHRHLE